LPQDAAAIGYIGRFTTMDMEKGIATLVEAMKFLAASGASRALLLCVGGPMDVVPRYQALGRRLGIEENRLRFIDRVPTGDVPRWIRACDVVTIPWPWNEFSAYYTSPMKLFEYMAAGVPIVASDLPSLREVLRHGENAWLVQPGDPAGLAAGIGHLLRYPELAGRLAQTARTEAGTYTWQHRAAKVLRECFQEELPPAHSGKAL
jgi:glycosyltransferase involved in cell wall biosynthesis